MGSSSSPRTLILGVSDFDNDRGPVRSISIRILQTLVFGIPLCRALDRICRILVFVLSSTMLYYAIL